MRLTICLIAAIALVPVATPVGAKTAHKAAAFEIDHTTWTLNDHGKMVRESIDADGNYVTRTMGGKTLDHGTAVMKGDKVCFTSAVNKQGEMCWTTHPVAVGHSMQTVSDKGAKLTVHRVAYVAMKAPK